MKTVKTVIESKILTLKDKGYREVVGVFFKEVPSDNYETGIVLILEDGTTIVEHSTDFMGWESKNLK